MFEEHDQIKGDNMQLVLANLLDMDGDGSVTPKEIADFFINVWEDPRTRRMINTLSKQRQEEEKDKLSYLLIKQFLSELSLDYYLDIFKAKGCNSNMLLNASLQHLKKTFTEIDPEHLSLIDLKAREHTKKKQLFYDIRDQAIWN